MIQHLPLLTLLLFLPLCGGLLLPLFRGNLRWLRFAAMGVALLELALTVVAWHETTILCARPGMPPGFTFYENQPWIEPVGIRYILGMDGISLLMVLLTAFITVIAILASWRAVSEKAILYYLLILVMESGIMGVFLSLDLFLFYLFWEVMLIPMFFLIGIWGHGQSDAAVSGHQRQSTHGRCVYSALKFFLFTLVGSLLMLLAIMAIYLLHGSQTGSYSFALADLTHTVIPHAYGLWLYGAFLLAFAIKFPLFPVHTWLPDAHTDAPTAGSIILAALLLKTGAYGLIRFGYPLFPDAARTFTPLLVTLAVVGIIYASWVAFAQTDMKRLIAYSSIGHMGFVMLGIAAWNQVALSGAIVQMVNHGLTTGALFAVIGMLDERTHTREIEAYGGVWGKAPTLSCFLILFSMASAGLPGLNNFVGEFLILTGTFRVWPVAAAIACVGIVLPLIYTVRLLQEVLFQTERQPLTIADLTWREGTLLGLIALLAVAIGLHPAPLLEIIRLPITLITGVPQ